MRGRADRRRQATPNDSRKETRAPGERNAASVAEESTIVDGLNPDDPGLLSIARVFQDVAGEELLLAYCGAWRSVDSAATRLILDRREESQNRVTIATFEELSKSDRRFRAAAVWPRAHLGKDFSQLAMAQAGLLLRDGGRLCLAARKSKGAKSLAHDLERLFGEAPTVVARDRGYAVYEVVRTSNFDTSLANAWVEQRYAIEDARLGVTPLVSAPGVFSRKALDAGTAALIDFVDELEASGDISVPRSVLDLCCGSGPLTMWAARRWPNARVFAWDSNYRAVAMARENVAAAGLESRVHIDVGDGLPVPTTLHPELRKFVGKIRLAVINPPTHLEAAGLVELFRPLPEWMGPGGRAYLVASRPGSVQRALQATGAIVDVFQRDAYCILGASWPAGRHVADDEDDFDPSEFIG